jgi:hypothetical protein
VSVAVSVAVSRSAHHHAMIRLRSTLRDRPTSVSSRAPRQPATIEAARADHSLGDVVRRADTNLCNTSGSVMVRCPLPSHGHFDRSPSLRLHLDDGVWHCFGCGQTETSSSGCARAKVGDGARRSASSMLAARSCARAASEPAPVHPDLSSGRRTPTASVRPRETPGEPGGGRRADRPATTTA